MRDLALQAAGVLAILVAIAHGIIVERKVFARVRIEPQRTRGLLRMLCQASTVDWIAIGLLFIVVPALGSDAVRHGSLQWRLSYMVPPPSATPWSHAGGTSDGS